MKASQQIKTKLTAMNKSNSSLWRVPRTWSYSSEIESRYPQTVVTGLTLNTLLPFFLLQFLHLENEWLITWHPPRLYFKDKGRQSWECGELFGGRICTPPYLGSCHRYHFPGVYPVFISLLWRPQRRAHWSRRVKLERHGRWRSLSDLDSYLFQNRGVCGSNWIWVMYLSWVLVV